MSSSDGGSDAFARKVTAQAAAHVCLKLEISEASKLAVAGLADATAGYIESIGTFAKASAEAGGRGEAGLLDVLAGLRMLSPPLHWRELRAFAFGKDEADPAKWEQPFCHAVPTFPVRKRPRVDATALANAPVATSKRPRPEAAGESKMNGGGSSSGDAAAAAAAADDEELSSPLPPHIPGFLPPLPPPQTYRHTAAPAKGPHMASSVLRRERIKGGTQGRESFARITAASAGDGDNEAGAAGRLVAAEAAAAAAAGAASSQRGDVGERPPPGHFGALANGWDGMGAMSQPDERDEAMLPPLPLLSKPPPRPLPPGDAIAGVVGATAGVFKPAAPGSSSWRVVDKQDKGYRILEGMPPAETAAGMDAD